AALAVAALQGVTADGDHPFDVVDVAGAEPDPGAHLLQRGRQRVVDEGTAAVEDDDVAALDVTAQRIRSPHRDRVVDVGGRLHRGAGNGEAWDAEPADRPAEEDDEDRDGPDRLPEPGRTQKTIGAIAILIVL